MELSMRQSVTTLVSLICAVCSGGVTTNAWAQTVAPQKQADAPAPVGSQAAAQKALVDRYCVVCHNDKAKRANLSLQNRDFAAVDKNPELWEMVIRKLRAGMMPPPGMPRPPLKEYEGLRDYLEKAIDKSVAGHINPGTVILHRLNRTEYANVIRDLLDVDVDVNTLLPSDDLAHGFDNIAGSLTISQTLLEAYMTAATRIARVAVGYWKTPTEAKYIAPADISEDEHIEGLPFGTRGGMMVKHTFPADGEYRISVQNFRIGNFLPGEKLELLIDGERVALQDYKQDSRNDAIKGSEENDLSIDFDVPVKTGTHTVGATFQVENYGPFLDLIKQYERKSLENDKIPQLQYHPELGYLRIQGPFGAVRSTDSPSRRKIFTCRPADASQELPCANQILTALMRHAYRRPTTQADLERVMNFYEEGRRNGAFDDGIEMALRRILVNPEFLVRLEQEPPNLANGQIYHISDLELASRLSFFLWSGIPDDELLSLASQNKLHINSVLEQQVRRMMADPKSESLVKNFGDQVLYLRNLGPTMPDGVSYPNWDDELRNSFRRETELLFESIVKEDHNVVDLLTANYTFLNGRLAQHYGIPNIYGSQFRRVTLGPELDYRRGLLGQGSIEAITWVQNFRTSPVKRGVWVLENILGTPPPEPPPNVPPLEDRPAGATKILTLREQMTIHRKNEPCASCHKLMDPIGFALENFDADGSYRLKQGGDGGVPIDVSAELWDGQKVNGPVELRQALLRYSPQFVRTITEKLMTFALGRGVEYYDMPEIRAIVREADKNSDRFSWLVLGVIKSPEFRMRTKGVDKD
jgi:hypothetical protein